MGVKGEKTLISHEWPNTDIQFLAGHNYFTVYAQIKYAEKKGKNILKLKDIQTKQSDKRAIEEDKVNKIKAKKEVPERGIETMFRVSFKNHMELSGIADNKANIMLSINAIIISISLSTLIPNFDENPKLILPTMVLLTRLHRHNYLCHTFYSSENIKKEKNK